MPVLGDVDGTTAAPSGAESLLVMATASFPMCYGLEFAVWGRNLTNKAVLTTAYSTNLEDTVKYNPPRTYGIEAKYSW